MGALAVLLAGSASRGDADRYSDVGLYAVWDTVPATSVVRAQAQIDFLC